MLMTSLLLFNLTASIGAFGLLWLVSLTIKDVSIVDIYWGPSIALMAVLTWLRGDVSEPRALTLTLLVSLWALRLAWYLARRNLGHGEDVRYARMRKRAGSDRAFAVRSLFTVFLMQCLISFFISLPVQIGQFGSGTLSGAIPGTFGALAYVGIGLFFVGLLFEALGDHQLKVFKRDPANKGRLMDKGLWSWTRHPNYFGDATVWFGLTLIALESEYGYLSVLSPVVMLVFLYFLSGKALTEHLMMKKYADYPSYKKRVSGFFPLPPKQSEH